MAAASRDSMPTAPTTPTTASNPSSAAITKAVIIIAIIGALNWGLVGFFGFNLVHAIFGGAAPEQPSVATRIIYMIVGLAGLVSAIQLPKLHLDARPTTHRAP
jgi:uncharacterized membrane protein YuzA (DUF378 family)